MKVSYQLYDAAGGPPVLLFKTNSIQTFVCSHFLISAGTGNKTTVSVYVVPPSAAADPTNAVLLNTQIAANSYLEGHGGFVLPAGGWAVWVSCDTGNSSVFNMSGDLIVNAE